MNLSLVPFLNPILIVIVRDFYLLSLHDKLLLTKIFTGNASLANVAVKVESTCNGKKKRGGGGGRRTLNPRGACALRAIPIVRLVSSNGIFM